MLCDIFENIVEYFCKICYDKFCSRCKGIYIKSKFLFDYEVILLIFEFMLLLNDVFFV